MRVLGLRRTARPGQQPPPFVDALYSLSDLHTVLGAADFVILAMPQTPQSEGMIGTVRAVRCGARILRIPPNVIIVAATNELMLCPDVCVNS